MGTLSNIKAIAVDYYGTLVDVGQPFKRIQEWFAAAYADKNVNAQKLFMRFSKERARLQYDGRFRLGYELLLESYEAACAYFHLRCRGKEFKDFIIDLFIIPKAFPYAVHTINTLRKKVPVLLLTNADNCCLYPSVQLRGFQFDCIITSEDERCGKPNPAMFIKACSVLERNAENVLMIGDSLTEDVQGAVNCGMKAIWVSPKEMEYDERSCVRVSSIVNVLQLLQC